MNWRQNPKLQRRISRNQSNPYNKYSQGYVSGLFVYSLTDLQRHATMVEHDL